MVHNTPDRVRWASYAGEDFTDRQRIKRKAQSWAKRYQAMPRAERLAVMTERTVEELVLKQVDKDLFFITTFVLLIVTENQCSTASIAPDACHPHLNDSPVQGPTRRIEPKDACSNMLREAHDHSL